MSTDDPADDGRKGVQSVEHAARVLQALIAAGVAAPLKDISARAGMSASTAHRYLTSLSRVELVRQDAGSGHYDLGALAVRLGLAALQRYDYVLRADECLRALTQSLRIDGHVSVWGDHGPTIIRIHQANSPILTNLRLGRTLPLAGSASGRVFLAYMPEEATHALLAAELARAPDALRLREELEASRKAILGGEIAWVDGSVIPGLRAIAAPILDMQGGLRACMALVSPDESLVRFPNRMADELLGTARATSHELGWRGA